MPKFSRKIVKTFFILLVCNNIFATAIEINCRFGEDVGKFYTCVVKNVNIKSAPYKTSISGVHWRFKINDDVIGFQLSLEKDLTSIPFGIGSTFTNLEYFAWEQSNLRKISAKDLKQFPSLKILSLSGNFILAMNEHLFKHNLNLIQIDFSSNVLRSIDSNVLDNLNHLKYANFEDNNCVNFRAIYKSQMRKLRCMFNDKCGKSPMSSSSKRVSSSYLLMSMVCVAAITLLK